MSSFIKPTRTLDGPACPVKVHCLTKTSKSEKPISLDTPPSGVPVLTLGAKSELTTFASQEVPTTSFKCSVTSNATFATRFSSDPMAGMSTGKNHHLISFISFNVVEQFTPLLTPNTSVTPVSSKPVFFCNFSSHKVRETDSFPKPRAWL